MKFCSFCNMIRNARKLKKLPLREVAAFLDIDTSTLSKIERGEHHASRDLLRSLSQILELEFEELYSNYLSDKIANYILDENASEEILSFAEEKVRYFRKSNKAHKID